MLLFSVARWRYWANESFHFHLRNGAELMVVADGCCRWLLLLIVVVVVVVAVVVVVVVVVDVVVFGG